MRRTSSYSFANGNCVEVDDMPFRKSSHSVSGHCTEVGYRKSSHSSINGQCAEAGQAGGVILVRDTKQAHLGDARTVLAFSPGVWMTFMNELKEDAV